MAYNTPHMSSKSYSNHSPDRDLSLRTPTVYKNPGPPEGKQICTPAIKKAMKAKLKQY